MAATESAQHDGQGDVKRWVAVAVAATGSERRAAPAVRFLVTPIGAHDSV
jgi:hypothetical protein